MGSVSYTHLDVYKRQMLIAILWPQRINAKAAIAGAIVGEGVYMTVYLFTNIEKSVMAAGAWGLIASFAAMWLLSSGNQRETA